MSSPIGSAPSWVLSLSALSSSGVTDEAPASPLFAPRFSQPHSKVRLQRLPGLFHPGSTPRVASTESYPQAIEHCFQLRAPAPLPALHVFLPMATDVSDIRPHRFTTCDQNHHRHLASLTAGRLPSWAWADLGALFPLESASLRRTVSPAQRDGTSLDVCSFRVLLTDCPGFPFPSGVSTPLGLFCSQR